MVEGKRPEGGPALRLDRQRLMAELEQREWTIRKLADETGLHYNTVYRIASYERPLVTVYSLSKIAEALGMPMAYFLLDAEGESGGEEMRLQAEAQYIASLMERLSSARQLELRRFAESLTEVEQEEKERRLADVEANRHILDQIKAAGGQAALTAALTLIGQMSGLGDDDIRRVLPLDETGQKGEEE